MLGHSTVLSTLRNNGTFFVIMIRIYDDM